MATVEQRETQPSGLSALSNTLDLFNDFKDDKDSDEESFHLPLLDCEDDLDSNNKENVSNSTEKDIQNGETEDEILNKFETTVTPDIDPKIEDKLLDELDEVCEKKADEENAEVGAIASQNLQNKETTSVEKVDEKIDVNNKENDLEIDLGNQNDICVPDSEQSTKDNEENENDIQNTECEKVANDEEKISENERPASETALTELSQQEEKDEPAKTENSTADNEIMEVEPSEEPNKNNIDVTEGNDALNDKTNITNDVETEDIGKDANSPNVEENLLGSVDNKIAEDENCHVENNITGKMLESQTDNKMEVDEITEITQPEININKTTSQTANTDLGEVVLNESEDSSQNKDNVLEQDVKSKCTELSEELPECDTKENVESNLIDSSNDNKEVNLEENIINDIVMEEDSSQCKENDATNLKDKENKVDLSTEGLCEEKENKTTELTSLEDFNKPKEIAQSKSENVEKYENSNDFNKNNDCEDDLLDISIIRDADEDNASAIAENANDNHSSDKSDNDDQEEGSEKAENEESEMDQDESSLANDKDDRMDFDEGNSNHLAYQENTVSGSTSDSEVKDYDTRDSENESSSSNVLKEKTNRINGVIDSEKNQTDAITTELKDADEDASAATSDQDSHKENSIKLGGKRLLTDTESSDAKNKKIKLTDNATGVSEKKKSKKIKTLVSFEKFMQSKTIEKKLTRSDLEQFCLQKICEAIVHKTDVGELHQTIKKQEQIIENLRKDIQQLTKQTRDLDIVNKKLMNELRAQNGIKKPLVPLKITRSVGLQVKLNVGSENNVRRKTTPASNSRTPNANNTRQRPAVSQNANVVRQIATSPRKTPNSTPILSQALQNSRQTPPTTPVVKRPPIRPKPAPKPAETKKPTTPGVIDLTDEDDRASKTATGTPLKLVTKTNLQLSQTKSMSPMQNKTVPGKTMNTNNQNKTVAIGQVKTAAKVTTPTRTVTTLPQGVRLTPTQVKNGSITIPASVVTSSAGTTQLMYVVQPTSSLGSVVTSTAGGTQKAVLLNFQSANGVLTSTLNGSAVSVIPTKTPNNTVQLKTVAAPRKHPAPLPLPPPVALNASLKPLLPKPHLSIRKTDTGIILQWRMPYNLDIYEGIASYQLFAYQETNAVPSTEMWRKVGDVKALALPMACTLTQFADKNKYYFAVRSVDVHKRIGAFSDPEEISL